MGPSAVMKSLIAKLNDPDISHLDKHIAQRELDAEAQRELRASINNWVRAGRPEGPAAGARKFRAEHPLEKVLEREEKQDKAKRAEDTDEDQVKRDAIKLGYELLGDPNATAEMKEKTRAIIVALGEDPDEIAEGAKAIAHMGRFSGRARRVTCL
jgi:hypothetical protein